MPGHCILSHGFESGPDATKVTALAVVAERYGWTCERPDFTDLDAKRHVGDLGDVAARVQRLLALARSVTARRTPLVLAGSSLGAWISGRVEWIGVRPMRDVPMQPVDGVEATAGAGLAGDRYTGGSGKRGVTLIQAEHLPVIAALSGHDAVAPALLRRNVVVSGIPLVALKGRRFRIGEVVLEGTDSCDPCSRMEAALGAGGYNAMRGHGGLCARILEGGRVRIGDIVLPIPVATA